MIKKRFIFFVFIVMFSFLSLEASGYGTVSGQIVNLHSSARGAAMGYIMGAIDGEADAVVYNPAGLHSIRGHQARFSHLVYFLDSKMSSLTYGQNIGKIGTGIKFKIFSAEDTERDALGEKIDDFNIRFTQVSIGAGSMVAENIAAGGALKVLSEIYDLDEDPVSSSAFALDLGLWFEGRRDSSFGITLKNLGPEMKVGKEKSVLDRKAALSGVSRMNGYLLVGEVSTSRQYSVAGGAGFEVDIVDIFKLRGGVNYVTGFEFMGGFGVEWDMWKFDYAFLPNLDMGLGHRISLGASF